MNLLSLNAKILNRDSIRYNYAGIPVLEMTLSSFSKVLESNVERNINLTIKALALGALAMSLDKIPYDKEFFATGFLAPIYKNSVILRFHLQKIINSDD
ncbi:MAG: primosomal replication protein N [Candidatus Kinetoplastibacterium crithidii]|nr:primosomal replication protein N [Candidatus Kinetoplastibacterium crithidii]